MHWGFVLGLGGEAEGVDALEEADCVQGQL